MSASRDKPPASISWNLVPMDFQRSGLIFSWYAYARIVARKHGMPAPEPESWDPLSNEEIEIMVNLLRDLSHLPPQ